MSPKEILVLRKRIQVLKENHHDMTSHKKKERIFLLTVINRTATPTIHLFLLLVVKLPYKDDSQLQPQGGRNLQASCKKTMLASLWYRTLLFEMCG